MSDTPVSDILSGPEKWCQKSYGTSDGRVCLATACFRDCSVLKGKERKSILLKAIAKLFPDRHACILSHFNDHPDTTFEDVRAVLREAGL